MIHGFLDGQSERMRQPTGCACGARRLRCSSQASVCIRATMSQTRPMFVAGCQPWFVGQTTSSHRSWKQLTGVFATRWETVRALPRRPACWAHKQLGVRRAALRKLRATASLNEKAGADGAIEITVEYQDRTEVVRCQPGQSILEAVEASGLWTEVPSSCRAGVCTTCAAWLLSGDVEDPFAALDANIRKEGFILTCSSTPKADAGPVRIRLGAYDQVYEMQYGRFEKAA